MKQKYLILKGEDRKSIIIKEFAELDKDMLSLLCEETYDIKGIEAAVSGGKDAVVSAIRTSNMYPAGVYAEKIADSIITLYKSKDQDSVEVYFDDFDEEEDNYDEDFDEKTTPIKKIDSSIQVEDDDSAEYEEDV